MLIGISGKSRNGKNVSGEILQKYLGQLYNTEFVLMSYADELKKKVMIDFDLTYEQAYIEREIPDNRYPKGDGIYWTPREILQFIGTDAYRHIDNNFWVKKLFDNIEKMCYSDVIITDVRLPNEVEAVKSRSGFHIRVERPNCNIFVNGSNHASETSLLEEYDYKLINNGSLEDLEKNIVYFLIPKIKEYFENSTGGN
jgi:hypothetical protein